MTTVIKGQIQKIDRVANIVNYTPSRAAVSVYDSYIHYLEINGKRFFFNDKNLRVSTKVDHQFELIADTNDNILAWKNQDAKTNSGYNVFHILFSANNIVAIGILFFALYVTKSKPEWRSIVLIFGISLLVAVFFHSLIRGIKKMQAQKILMG